MYLLLVDYNLINNEDLQVMLDQAPDGTDIVNCNSLETLLNVTEKLSPDIIIVDFEMVKDEINGLFDNLRDKGRQSHVMALIEPEHYEYLYKAIEGGSVDDFMVKPINKEDFFARIKIAMRKRQAAAAHIALDLEKSAQSELFFIDRTLDEDAGQASGDVSDLIFEDLDREVEEEPFADEYTAEAIQDAEEAGIVDEPSLDPAGVAGEEEGEEEVMEYDLTADYNLELFEEDTPKEPSAPQTQQEVADDDTYIMSGAEQEKLEHEEKKEQKEQAEQDLEFSPALDPSSALETSAGLETYSDLEPDAELEPSSELDLDPSGEYEAASDNGSEAVADFDFSSASDEDDALSPAADELRSGFSFDDDEDAEEEFTFEQAGLDSEQAGPDLLQAGADLDQGDLTQEYSGFDLEPDGPDLDEADLDLDEVGADLKETGQDLEESRPEFKQAKPDLNQAASEFAQFDQQWTDLEDPAETRASTGEEFAATQKEFEQPVGHLPDDAGSDEERIFESRELFPGSNAGERTTVSTEEIDSLFKDDVFEEDVSSAPQEDSFGASPTAYGNDDAFSARQTEPMRDPFGAEQQAPPSDHFGAPPSGSYGDTSFDPAPAAAPQGPSFGVPPTAPPADPSFGAAPIAPPAGPSFGAPPIAYQGDPSFASPPKASSDAPSFGAAPTAAPGGQFGEAPPAPGGDSFGAAAPRRQDDMFSTPPTEQRQTTTTRGDAVSAFEDSFSNTPGADAFGATAPGAGAFGAPPHGFTTPGASPSGTTTSGADAFGASSSGATPPGATPSGFTTSDTTRSGATPPGAQTPEAYGRKDQYFDDIFGEPAPQEQATAPYRAEQSSPSWTPSDYGQPDHRQPDHGQPGQDPFGAPPYHGQPGQDPFDAPAPAGPTVQRGSPFPGQSADEFLYGRGTGVQDEGYNQSMLDEFTRDDERPEKVHRSKKKPSGGGFSSFLSVFGNVIFVVLLLVMATLSFFLIQSRITGGVPEVAGYQMYIVLSGSMSPEFDTGALAFVREIEPFEIQAGDIITYRSRADSDSLTTHRVVEVVLDDGLKFVTRGDANNVNDPNPVLAENVVGHVTGSVPYVGYVLNFVQTRQGLILLIFVPGVLIILFELGKIMKYLTSGEGKKEKQGRRKVRYAEESWE